MNARLALVASLALLASACSCHAKVGSIHPARELVQYRPKDPAAKISAVSLSESTSANFDESRVGTSLPASATHAVVWYQWQGADPGRKVEIHWYKGEQPVLTQEDAMSTPSGESAWVLMPSHGGTLPVGSYHVDLLEGGKVVTSVPFSVGQ
jgi:hypothetical protein